MIRLRTLLLASLCAISTTLFAQNNDINIVAGKAKIEGNIKATSKLRDSITVEFQTASPLTLGNIKKTTLVRQDGSFSTELHTELNTQFIYVKVSTDPYNVLLVKAVEGQTTKIELDLNAKFAVRTVKITPYMNDYDVLHANSKMEIIQEPAGERQRFYEMEIEDFLQWGDKTITTKVNRFDKVDSISLEIKNFLKNSSTHFLYSTYIFDYNRYVEGSYMITNNTNEVDYSKIKQVGRNYYKFLKKLELGKNESLLSPYFATTQLEILRNQYLQIPEILDVPVQAWINIVKTRLSDLLGPVENHYYEILAANAYSRQLEIKASALNPAQISNIKSFWGSGEIAKILFRKNDEIESLQKFKTESYIVDVAAISPEQVIPSILARHKDKVILIDLWATWCGPCLQAMDEFKRDKTTFYGKDVAFIYLSNGSSPKALWEETIVGIGNEHYYLTEDQWVYVMEKYNFEYIPAYVLFNKKGELSNTFFAVPEEGTLKKLIDNLLAN